MRQDKVSPELRRQVFERDGACVMSMRDSAHQCYDVWGEPHASDDLDRMTAEHIKDQLRMGKRGPSDPRHLVTLCGFRNVIRPLSKVERSWCREYLRRVEPEREDVA